MPEQALRLFPTEAAAKKAGLQLASFDGPRLATILYALLPAGEIEGHLSAEQHLPPDGGRKALG